MASMIIAPFLQGPHASLLSPAWSAGGKGSLTGTYRTTSEASCVHQYAPVSDPPPTAARKVSTRTGAVQPLVPLSFSALARNWYSVPSSRRSPLCSSPVFRSALRRQHHGRLLHRGEVQRGAAQFRPARFQGPSEAWGDGRAHPTVFQLSMGEAGTRRHWSWYRSTLEARAGLRGHFPEHLRGVHALIALAHGRPRW